MTILINYVHLVALPLVLLLTGYLLAARLTQVSAAERLAGAVLGGLAILLWNVAAVNFFRPLAGPWAWLCLWPVAVTLLWPAARSAAWRDVVTVASNRRGAIALATAVGFLLVLLWPLLTRPELVFYDGTSNHDAFFWIVAAEHLMRHSYLTLPPTLDAHPLMHAVPAIIGWQPAWGRMGGEGYLALCGSLAGTEVVRIYLAATAALLAPWIAAVFLIVRTFVSDRLSLAGMLALVALQPVFVFFHNNANLPNLLGALCAGGVVVAVERALRGGEGRFAWLVLLALSTHGVLCSYPEMAPFVALPAGLLWLRAWLAGPLSAVWRPATTTALAGLVGLALNPASLVRAWVGFVASFDTARANQNWANLFEPLSFAEFVPALATLSVGAANQLGALVGVLATALLIGSLVLAWRHAKDRAGTLLILSGAATLLGYTMVTGFHYGWQKTVQFGGPMWAALFPVALLDSLASAADATPLWRRLSRAALLALAALFGYAVVWTCLESYRWSRQKLLTEDWFTLREQVRTYLPGAPILVDGATFRMAFFHGMWATYFLPGNPLYFAARGHENGGYLRAAVKNEQRDPLPPIAGYLVSRDWADSFDADSARLFAGDTVVLLAESNRVMHSSGFHPENGPPENAAAQLAIDILPHSPSEFVLVLGARPFARTTTAWHVRRVVDGVTPFTADVSGPPPWHIEVPLVPGRLNRLEFTAAPAPEPNRLPPFIVTDVAIRSTTP